MQMYCGLDEIQVIKPSLIVSTETKQNFAEKRSFLRKACTVIENQLYKSLQTCKVEHNLFRLQSLRDNSLSKSFRRRMDALICIFEMLSLPPNDEVLNLNKEFESCSTPSGILDFKVASEIYVDITQIPLQCRVDDIQTRLKDDLIHQVHGIRCIIYTNKSKRYIILDSDNLSLTSIFKKLCEDETFINVTMCKKQQHNIDYDFTQSILKTLDSEHDRSVVKALLATFLSPEALANIGIVPQTAMKDLEALGVIQCEVNNTLLAAKDMIQQRLEKEIKSKQSELDSVLNIDYSHLSQMRRSDVDCKVEMLQEIIKNKTGILLHEDKYNSQKFNQAVGRLAKKLIRENRVKLRRLGAGPKPLLDCEDEQFIANAIESKSSAHGRRHDSVLYLNHRVKSRDLLSIANYNLYKRGKKMIKSARTVWLRARPRRINTIEGRKHKGDWLFCSKKPPKTEDHETELTHHQRAHIKLNRTDMFGSNSICSPAGIEISFDDKAYIRPGTDVGLRDTKCGKILQVSDENKQRKLPQHVFGTPEVYQTPSSFRVMTWKTEIIEGNDNLVKNTDHSYVTIRPKFYVGSSGSVWASDLIRLRYEDPDVFEIDSQSCFSKQERKLYAIVRDIVFHVKDSFNEDDLASLKNGGTDFRCYEEKKMNHLKQKLTLVLTELTTNTPDEIVDSIQTLLQSIGAVMQCLKSDDSNNFNLIENHINTLVMHCEALLDKIDRLDLPSVNPVIAEYTDAGPGVGVSNSAVRFRFAEMCRIQNSVRRVRIHRVCGDSAQNEAERTNSAIGDALVDGASLRWDYYHPYEGMSELEVQELSSAEVEQLKSETMEKYAWAVSNEIRLRIDDASDPS